MVPLRRWQQMKDFHTEHTDIVPVWTSPSFNHCVFTAATDFDSALGDRFAELVTTMNPDDPLVAEFNRAEGTRKWIAGDAKGFEALVSALQAREGDKKK